ncbi:hypothetical protein LCGC14_3063760 [marine sediment metagenome]|uniref:ABC transporter domain-containing protein n=1 Tax=marine sediment metagenome TaxID=412755 RepID=A0A0F8WIN6_9ZZZZ
MDSGKQNVVSVKGLCKSYNMGEIEINVLNDITFDIHKGDIVSIIGPSGVGKSTLLNILGTLDKPTAGNVYIDSEDVTEFNEDKLAHFRNKKIGFVFQFYHLLPELRVLENVLLPQMVRTSVLRWIKERKAARASPRP